LQKEQGLLSSIADGCNTSSELLSKTARRQLSLCTQPYRFWACPTSRQDNGVTDASFPCCLKSNKVVEIDERPDEAHLAICIASDNANHQMSSVWFHPGRIFAPAEMEARLNETLTQSKHRKPGVSGWTIACAPHALRLSPERPGRTRWRTQGSAGQTVEAVAQKKKRLHVEWFSMLSLEK